MGFIDSHEPGFLTRDSGRLGEGSTAAVIC